mmetsp:Transcript_53311/g.165256  ORF Transcript_53311/g.165256 Transcript_53311/m.165256 type:complete len:248 (-) Transcript_53311:72-815(-)
MCGGTRSSRLSWSGWRRGTARPGPTSARSAWCGCNASWALTRSSCAFACAGRTLRPSSQSGTSSWRRSRPWRPCGSGLPCATSGMPPSTRLRPGPRCSRTWRPTAPTGSAGTILCPASGSWPPKASSPPGSPGPTSRPWRRPSRGVPRFGTGRGPRPWSSSTSSPPRACNRAVRARRTPPSRCQVPPRTPPRSIPRPPPQRERGRRRRASRRRSGPAAATRAHPRGGRRTTRRDDLRRPKLLGLHTL